MKLPETVTVRLALVDGSKKVIQFKTPENARERIGGNVRSLLDRRAIAFHVDNKLLIIPMSQILTIEFEPMLDVKLSEVINDATVVSTDETWNPNAG